MQDDLIERLRLDALQAAQTDMYAQVVLDEIVQHHKELRKQA